MYLDMALTAASYSESRELKVGSLVVLDDQILSIGINGTPPGWETNECDYINEQGILTTRPEVDHSEANAIQKLTRCTISSKGSTMFCTHAPCLPCAKLIAGAGISALYYITDYKSQDGILYLRKRNVVVEKVEIN